MNYNKYRVCVIDDEQDVRQQLVHTLEKSGLFEVVGEEESVTGGLLLIEMTKPDAVFLDIKIREGDAFMLLSQLEARNVCQPGIILNTGYSEFEYAQRAINFHKGQILLILKKPFWEDWDLKQYQITEAINQHHSTIKNDSYQVADNRVKIKSDTCTWLIAVKDILYLEVCRMEKGSGKINIITMERPFQVNGSLSQFEQQLPEQFLRISRYALINKEVVSHVDHSDRTVFLKGVNDRSFGLGDSYADHFFKALGI